MKLILPEVDKKNGKQAETDELYILKNKRFDRDILSLWRMKSEG